MSDRRGFIKKCMAVPLAIAAGKLTAIAAVLSPKPNYVVEVRLSGETVAKVPIRMEVETWHQLEIGLTPLSVAQASVRMGANVKVENTCQKLDDFYVACE